MLWLIWSLGLLAALILYLRNIYSHFDKQGVKTDTVVPFFGSMLWIVLRMEHLAASLHRLYFKYPEERFVGRFEFTKPVLLIRDLELIKKITIKDVDHFLDHRISINSDDPYFGRTLFSLKGQEWRDMRPVMSPAFTGSKMRLMVSFMVEAGDQMIHNLKKSMEETDSSYLDIETKDLMNRYACDVMASCAYGLKVDSHSERNNVFYKKAVLASSFKFRQVIVWILCSSCPWLLKSQLTMLKTEDGRIASTKPEVLREIERFYGQLYTSIAKPVNDLAKDPRAMASYQPPYVMTLKIRFYGTETANFFRDVVLSIMQDREKNNIIRPDIIQLIIEAKKGKLIYDEKTQDADAGFATVEESTIGKNAISRVWTEDDLIVQAVVFFIGGFENIASAMTFLLYEIAINPDVQNRLALEIRETHAKNKGKFDYNAVQQMTYMDMVVSEVLRKYTMAVSLDRMCTKDYNLGKPNDKATKDYILRKGDGLQIPVWAIHYDPQYYPDPEKFDPERFSDENKHNIKPFTYMPFGLGPRNCIGSRFALCEIKVMAYQLLRQIEVFPGPKTIIPYQLNTGTVNIEMKGGHWLRFKIRA